MLVKKMDATQNTQKWYAPTELGNTCHVDNLIAFYNLATSAERIEGLYWYNNARMSACDLSAKYKLPFPVCCGVIAILSPGMPWVKNVEYAELVIQMALAGFEPSDYKVATYGNNKTKAHKLVLTGDLSLVSGDKVSSFYENILDPMSQAVTVDRHAIKAWLGFQGGGGVHIPPKLYPRVAEDYRKAAQTIGVTASGFQAVCWVVYKRMSKELVD